MYIMATKRQKIRICENCGAEFEYPRKKKYCSRECLKEGSVKNQPKVIHDCIICGKQTETFQYVVSQGLPVYCSESCKKQRYELTCKNCGKTFRSSKADTKGCSEKCSLAIARSHTATVKCEGCNKEFNRPTMDIYSGKRIFCSTTCSNRVYGREHPNRYGTTWTTVRRHKLRQQPVCEVCGVSSNLEVHHIVRLLDFDTPEEANNLDNLQVLCKSCHSEKHK